MLYREFNAPPPSPPSADESGPVSADLQARLLDALRESSHRIAQLTAAWMRVGFCQGNFNSDNCLVAGRTLDYGNTTFSFLNIWSQCNVFFLYFCDCLGPFGFMERYERNW